ncbi:uncharacterized protein [Porites lutea]|uniref:uncharacterized protein isoform X1 n=1 Tax=Porites lutea TaxID=51062 RepID=UPI003CC63ED5
MKNMADVPPSLTLELPKKSDLPNTLKPWNEVHLPIDILLLTVDDCEFLACFTYLRNAFKSYLKNLGYVYFGNMGESRDVPLKVALIKCSEGSSAPDGSLVTVKNAVVELRPKAVFSVGCCGGLNPEVTKLQLGDVVVSSKLLTEAFKTPVGRDILHLVRHADYGWIPPLKCPEDHIVQVCCNGEILSGINPVSAKQQNMSYFTQATAVEISGEGLFAAAHDLKIEWVIVKGISHFADGNNPAEKSWESHACIMAASLVSNMLKDLFVFEQWPHYEDPSARKQPSSSTATKEELPDSLCLEECQKQLRSIYETNSKVKIVPWDQSSAVHIDEIYTQLSWLMDEKRPSGVTQKKLKHYTDIFDGGRPNHTPKRILVHGRPGIGKTVFTQKATFDWSQHRVEGKLGRFDLVLLVKLRDVCNLNDVPAILSAANLLASDGPISTDNLYDYVRYHQEKVLLILDGYDEYVHSAASQSPVLQIWEKKQLRDCCVIITSRDMKAEGLKSSSDAQFEIDGFDHRRQEEFARRFLKDDQDVAEFFKYLWQQDLQDVAKIPILLLMLLLVWNEKDREGLPSSRVKVYFQFLQTMFNHMSEKQKKPAVKVDDHKEELCKVGELAFDALLQDLLYFPLSKLPDPVLTEKLIEVGLFQLLNMSALHPCKAVHFIHKSMQEFLASLFLKEKLLSQESKNNSLFKVDSIEKIFKLNEVFKFTAEMSEEAALEILSHLLGMAAKEDGEYSFDNQAPSGEDLSNEQRNLLTLCTQLFFYCSADTRTELFPTFLSNLGGVLFILNPDQLDVAVKENFVKTTASPMYIFFSKSGRYTEQSYNNLISLVQQLNAVIVSRTGEQKASEFLNVFPWRRVDEFFLMKEENNTHLYFFKIVKDEISGFPLPFKMVKALVSLEETTKKTNMNGDESSEESSSSCCSKRHGLSRVRWIDAYSVNRSEVEQLIEMMPFITAPHVIWVFGKLGEVFDAEVTESLLRSIPTTHKLERLSLKGINVTSSPAVEFISRVFEQDHPNLWSLLMSGNPLLGAGVDSLIKHLSCAPHLEALNLEGVKMTPQQVMNLTSAVQQHGNNTKLVSSYHDRKGNPKPEHEWPSENYWKSEFPHIFPDSSPESAHEQEQQNFQDEVENYNPTTRGFEGAEDEDVAISYAGEPLDVERNTESEHERPDLIPDLSSESGMELQLAILRSLMIPPELPDPLSESEMEQEQQDKTGNLKQGDARSFGESRDPQEQTELVKDPHVQPKQVSSSSPTLDTRPSCQDAPFTVAVPAPSASPASTLLVRAFIPMAHGPNPGFHVRPNLSPQGQAQDHIPSPSLWRYPVTVPPPPGMPGYSVFRPMLTPPPTDLEPPSTSSDDPVD